MESAMIASHSLLRCRPIDYVVKGPWFLVLIHIGALATFLVETDWVVWLVFFLVLPVRGLTTTVAYHRYFAHRSFKTSRVFQFILGCLCCTNLQRGPMWW